MKNYKLTHEYSLDTEFQDIYFSSKLSKKKLSETIAYIQFLTDEMFHAKELSEIEIVSLIKIFYDKSLIINNEKTFDYEIDLYLNWEGYCSSAEIILTNETLKKEGIENWIKSYIENLNVILKDKNLL